jgi:leader peptidase (prepilin peptidase) / N-methyltransferase
MVRNWPETLSSTASLGQANRCQSHRADSLEIDPVSLWADCLLGWTLLVLSWTDISCGRLLDALTLPLLSGGLALAALTSTSEIVVEHIAGAITGYLAFRAIAAGYRVLRGRDGLGGGDAKPLAVAGAWTGVGALPDVVLIGAMLAIAFVIARSMLGQSIKSDMSLPFGPFLAVGLWIARVYGPFLFQAGSTRRPTRSRNRFCDLNKAGRRRRPSFVV